MSISRAGLEFRSQFFSGDVLLRLGLLAEELSKPTKFG
jgi:hypothetical protein